MNWRGWLYSLATAAIGGAANSLGGTLIDPNFFNSTPAGLKHMAAAALIGALVPVAAFLKQSPLPASSSTSTTTVAVTKEVTKD